MLPFAHRVAVESLEDNPLWLVVLADMMTNLMLFFLVMFSMTLQGEPAKQALARALDDRGLTSPVSPRGERLAREFQEEETARALQERFGGVRVNEDAIRLSLREKLLFATADDRIGADAAKSLADLAQVLSGIPNTVVVEGHTDDVRVSGGAFRSNWELSVARSNSVIAGLVRAGLGASRLVAAGYGENLPAHSNETPEGRALNRRVEIVVLRNTPPDRD